MNPSSTANSTRRSSSLLRLLASTCALLVLPALAACSTRLKPTLAQVSGHNVEVVEAGAGDATVVFEAGLGDDWARWDEVAAEVAGRARVFAYSRPGYGDSDPSGAPRTATRIVEDLRALLTARGFAPPYILVGHSFGGTYMELFAKAHPEEVAALVLVDSRPRDFTVACQSAGFKACIIPLSAVGSQVEKGTRSWGSRARPLRSALRAPSGGTLCPCSPRRRTHGPSRSRRSGNRCTGRSPPRRLRADRSSFRVQATTSSSIGRTRSQR